MGSSFPWSLASKVVFPDSLSPVKFHIKIKKFHKSLNTLSRNETKFVKISESTMKISKNKNLILINVWWEDCCVCSLQLPSTERPTGYQIHLLCIFFRTD